MANLRIMVRNVVDTSTMTDSPAMLATLPVTNLQKPTMRERVARTTSLASQDIKLAWGSDQKMNMVAFTRHNWSTSATLRTFLYSDQIWTSSLYDSTALAAFSTSGLDTDNDIYTDRDFRGLKTTVQYFTEQTTVESMIARVADLSNADGYVEQTRMFAGEYFQTTYDPPYGGADLKLMDESRVARAYDGSMIVEKRYKARRLNLDLRFIPDADLDSLLAICRYAGRDREIFVSLYPETANPAEMYCHGSFRIVESPEFSPWFVGLARTRLVLEET